MYEKGQKRLFEDKNKEKKTNMQQGEKIFISEFEIDNEVDPWD